MDAGPRRHASGAGSAASMEDVQSGLASQADWSCSIAFDVKDGEPTPVGTPSAAKLLNLVRSLRRSASAYGPAGAFRASGTAHRAVRTVLASTPR